MKPDTIESSAAHVDAGVWRRFIGHWPRYAIGLVLLAVYQALQYWFDTRLRIAINHAIGDRHREAAQVGGMLIAVALAAFVIRATSRLITFSAGYKAEYELRRALLAHLHRLGPSFYRRMSTGEIMGRATNDLKQVRHMFGVGVTNVFNTTFALISALSVTLGISWKLTLASLAAIPLLILVIRNHTRHTYTRSRENQAAFGKMSEIVRSSVAAVRVVKSFALEGAQLANFNRASALYFEKSVALAWLRAYLGPVMQAVSTVGVIVVIWYGGHLVLIGELDAGGFLAFYRAFGRLTVPLLAFGFESGMLQRGRASYARLEEVFNASPEVVGGKGKVPEQIDGALEVRDLSFGYGSEPVIQNVSFTLPAGASLAIVGRIGSGKSTLAVLLSRLQPTPPGTVFLDGGDICDLPLHAVRAAIAYAQQNAFLFSTTVGRNVAYTLDDPDSPESLARTRKALREAGVLDEILSLPDGIDTVVGERGIRLSGGQKQRVALARALLAEPKLLVLDDPLSAVDARTERAILEAIDRVKRQRGVVLITHRVAAAARCESILVLDRGRVVERGTHDDLVRKGGLYARFAEEQRIEQELQRLAIENSVSESG